MRIISGKYRGKVIRPPKGLPVRPTTDQAKEALFNILQSRLGFQGLKVLDLFAGTGNMSFEFLSRGVTGIKAVDADARCVQFIQRTFQELAAQDAKALKMPVERFLGQASEAFDLVFMDPPYAMPGQDQLVRMILEKGWLAEDGLLILEHSSTTDCQTFPYFVETRKYGSSSFSFFQHEG
jgi:16S rRNA (guanine(966)-N(2))-methyltransferase RsmD